MGKITGPYGSANFQTAKTVCEDLGQKLLTIDSQEEEDYIKDNLDLVSKYIILKVLEDIAHFCGATETIVLKF